MPSYQPGDGIHASQHSTHHTHDDVPAQQTSQLMLLDYSQQTSTLTGITTSFTGTPKWHSSYADPGASSMPQWKNVKSFTGKGMGEFEWFIVESNVFHQSKGTYFFKNDTQQVLEAACHLDHTLKV